MKTLLTNYMKALYQNFYDEFIPLFLAPTIEDLLLTRGYEDVEDFMSDSFAFSFIGPMGKEEVRRYYYRDLIETLDVFDTLEELEAFLVKEYNEIRRRLSFGQIDWMMNNG